MHSVFLWRLIGVACLAWLLIAANPVQAESIEQVLLRSQQTRLDALPRAAADDTRAVRIRQSFDAVLHAAAARHPVALHVVRGGWAVEALHGGGIVAHVALADLPEGARRFILAHELGHMALGHWAQTRALYRKWIPGAVTPEHTQPVAADLGREASALAHSQEYEADAFGLQVMLALGHGHADVQAAFMHLGAVRDTPTHPSTRKRLAALRQVELASY
jgi:Zn-dependent protease with chaperone function